MPDSLHNVPEISFSLQHGRPLQLIQLTPQQQFRVVPSTAQALSSLAGPLGVASIVGKYRTGKSSLINRLLGLKPPRNFSVSPSVDACTKGIWVWSAPIENSETNVNILVMDTEGLSSTGKTQDQDIRLFTLSVLLSSYFIYNSVGVINESDVQDLGLVAHVYNKVAQSVEAGSQLEISRGAPRLL